MHVTQSHLPLPVALLAVTVGSAVQMGRDNVRSPWGGAGVPAMR
ncbi:hypothetical protein OAN61_00605 [bacterium]|nr:hypothetical protein [bacterium]